MKRFIALINFTDQGRRNIKESPERADAFIAVFDIGFGDELAILINAGRAGLRRSG